jgi:hypothetical protein
MMNIKNYGFAALLLLAGCAKNKLAEPASDLSATKQAANALKASSAAGDVVGKITVGYQGWFAYPGDGSAYNNWWHWSADNQVPGNANIGIHAWPDVREYTATYQTNFANLGNGQPAKVFSSFFDQTIDTHFRWMQENGIDAAAIQRFNPSGQEGIMRNATMVRVKTSAELHGVKFYVMYDLSGWNTFQQEIKDDWTNKMSAYTSSKSYAVQNGKPVVCIWGLGFADRTMTPAAELDVVNWFKSKGCYVIGGVPHEWRQYTTGSSNFDAVFKALNMISPWMVGAIGDAASSDYYYTNFNVPDVAYCQANGIDYQPCVLPGDLAAGQRKHGDFMWRQFYNMVRAGAQGIYISMFDEYNEGNQIAKTAENLSMVPAGSVFKGLDEDGVVCSADYYLRLTNDGGKMLKGKIALTSVRPTEPVVGGGTKNIAPIGQSIHLLGSNNLYIGGEDGTGPMYCNIVNPQAWETFTIVDAGNGKVALQSMGMYVSSENGQNPITCNRTAIGPWEQFDYLINADGTISLKGNNGLFISSENGTSAMTCNRLTAATWERFTVK